MKPRAHASLALLLACLLAGGCGSGEGSSEPLLAFGNAGEDPGEFNYPRAAAASHDRCYVVDKSARIQCFDTRGTHLFEWQMPEQRAGKPVGLGVAPDGRVFVADTHYGRVMVFDADGEKITEFGSFGEGPGQFKLPTDVVVDSQGFVYVAEYGGNDRINKFTPDFEYLFSFGGHNEDEARLLRPQGVMVAPDDTLWVADAGHHRICHFDGQGKLLGSFGGIGRAAGQLRFPYGVDRLSDGTLVVAEFGNNRVQRFRPDGTSLGCWGSAGRAPGELASPWAVAVLPGDEVLIVDGLNNRMQIIAGGPQSTWSIPRP